MNTLLELKAIHERMTRLEDTLKAILHALHDESTAHIDYLAMMTDVELEVNDEQ